MEEGGEGNTDDGEKKTKETYSSVRKSMILSLFDNKWNTQRL
jgi:hypothetical protein